jgi:hypothetical protein
MPFICLSVSARCAIGPAHRSETAAEVDQVRFRHLDAEGPDCEIGHGGLCQRGHNGLLLLCAHSFCRWSVRGDAGCTAMMVTLRFLNGVGPPRTDCALRWGRISDRPVITACLSQHSPSHSRWLLVARQWPSPVICTGDHQSLALPITRHWRPRSGPLVNSTSLDRERSSSEPPPTSAPSRRGYP